MKKNDLAAGAKARRMVLLASSTAIAAAFMPLAAQAQSGPAAGIEPGHFAKPEFALSTPKYSAPEFAVTTPKAAAADYATHDLQAPTRKKPEFAENNPQVTIQGPGQGYSTEPGEPNTDVQDGVNGIGQFYRADGFLCTGTLINPRTVLFAAHCVDDEDEDAFGPTGGIPAAFAFEGNSLPGLRAWFGAGYNTVVSQHVYNVNQIMYDPQATQRPESQGFLEGDIALATLDTPAINVPTWALLFSPLPAPDKIDSADGTGYHVTVSGYGLNGYGNGPVSDDVDFRRRAAENLIGILGSFNQEYSWLFGPDDYGLPQKLYQIDFDDPSRQNPFDFNVFKDDARDPEGLTAEGDSGGPLILDKTFAESVVIGTLSGGSRFFRAQESSTYGTTSFYQPLYLFWDYIVANSPYRYVSAKAGNGMWTDPDHWVTDLDPAFRVIGADGTLENGLPTTPGAGAFGDDPNSFGQVCDGESCRDLATGDIVDYEGNIIDPAGSATNPKITASTSNGLLKVSDAVLAQLGGGAKGAPAANAKASADDQSPALPDPTLENGLPGATDFVPNNADPDVVTTGNGDTYVTRARYFDVTLAAAGTTTLADDGILIDHLSLKGNDAKLDIAEDGTLLSLTAIDQYMGTVNVDGLIGTYGDYTLMHGLLSGTGRVVTPYLTNIMGLIAPGTIGTTGTLTVFGDVIMSSGSGLSIDLGDNGVSDVLAVNDFGTEDTPFGPKELSGIADLGGAVMFTQAQGARVRFNNNYTFLTAQGGIVGRFDATNPLSAILYPVLSYGDNAVSVKIEARPYSSVVNSNAPIEKAYAGLLDRNRAQYSKYSDLYGTLDLLNAGAIRSTLDSLAPRAQVSGIAMGTVALDATYRFLRQRLHGVQGGVAGGTLSMYGQPLQMAGNAANNTGQPDQMDGQSAQPRVEKDVLPDDVSAFLAGGYIDGHSRGIPTAIPYSRDDFDGFYIAGGIEKAVGDNGLVGIAFSYTDLDGQSGVAGQSAKSSLYQLSLYATTRLGAGIELDTQASAGSFSADSRRSVSIGTDQYRLRADNDAFTFQGEVGAGKDLGFGSMIDVTPRVAFRYSLLDFSNTRENGGGPALQYNLGRFESLEGRAGLTVALKGKIRPFATGTFVHDFKDHPDYFAANFVGGIGPDAPFALPSSDQNFGELGAGATVNLAGHVSLSASAQTTVFRKDLEYQSYRGTISFTF